MKEQKKHNCNKMITAIFTVILAIVCLVTMSGCSSEANEAAYSISQSADNFEIQRSLTVINLRTDTVILKCKGLISVDTDSDGDLCITYKLLNGKYGKHYVHMNEWLTYVVEDLTYTGGDPGDYEAVLLPEYEFSQSEMEQGN